MSRISLSVKGCNLGSETQGVEYNENLYSIEQINLEEEDDEYIYTPNNSPSLLSVHVDVNENLLQEQRFLHFFSSNPLHWNLLKIKEEGPALDHFDIVTTDLILANDSEVLNTPNFVSNKSLRISEKNISEDEKARKGQDYQSNGKITASQREPQQKFQREIREENKVSPPDLTKLSKKKRLFPVKRTKQKPLPILESDDIPSKNPSCSKNVRAKKNFQKIQKEVLQNGQEQSTSLGSLTRRDIDARETMINNAPNLASPTQEFLFNDYNISMENPQEITNDSVVLREGNTVSIDDITFVDYLKDEAINLENTVHPLFNNSISLKNMEIYSKLDVNVNGSSNTLNINDPPRPIFFGNTVSDSSDDDFIEIDKVIIKNKETTKQPDCLVFDQFKNSNPHKTPEEVIINLEIVKVNGAHLGILEPALGKLIYEIRLCLKNSAEFHKLLSKSSTVALLKCCVYLLQKVNKAGLDNHQKNYIQMGLISLQDIFSFIKNLVISEVESDLKRLARATSNLKNNEIPEFIKQFFVFKGLEVALDLEILTPLCQKVVAMQQEMSLHQESTNEKNKTFEIGGDNELIEYKFNISQNNNSDNKFSEECNEEENKIFNENNNDNTNHNKSSSIPNLSRKDLEMLVLNFANLEEDCKIAVKDYLSCLSVEDPHLASSLLSKIQ